MKTVIGVVVLAAVVGGLYLLNDATRSEDGKSILHVAREPDVLVEVAQPERVDIVRTVQAPGEVEAIDEVDVSSELVSKIVEMPVEEGDWVEREALLCRLDDADFRARVLSSEANVERLKAAIRQAEAEVERTEIIYEQELRLFEQGATSNDTMATMRANLAIARAALDMRQHELVGAEAALQSAREDLQKTVIRAPLSGVIAQLFAEQGEVVVTGTMNNPGTRIMVISDLSKMQVRCRVDETDAPLVAPGQPARIYLQSDTRRSIPGEVLRVGTKGTKPLGRDVVTFETLVLITTKDSQVRPGMTANVEIEVARQHDAVAVPVQAVVYRKRRDLPETLAKEYEARLAEQGEDSETYQAEYVRMAYVNDGGAARARLVETGISDAFRVEIKRGVEPAEAVIIGPYRSLDQLKDGSPVKLIEQPSRSTPGAPPPAASQPTKQDTTGAASSQPSANSAATSQPATGTDEHE